MKNHPLFFPGEDGWHNWLSANPANSICCCIPGQIFHPVPFWRCLPWWDPYLDVWRSRSNASSVEVPPKIERYWNGNGGKEQESEGALHGSLSIKDHHWYRKMIPKYPKKIRYSIETIRKFFLFVHTLDIILAENHIGCSTLVISNWDWGHTCQVGLMMWSKFSLPWLDAAYSSSSSSSPPLLVQPCSDSCSLSFWTWQQRHASWSRAWVTLVQHSYDANGQ